MPADEADTTTLEDELPLLAIKTPDGTGTVIRLVDAISDAVVPLDVKNMSSGTLHSIAEIPATSTIDEFIRQDWKDGYCCAMTSQVGQLSTELHIDHHGLLAR